MSLIYFDFSWLSFDASRRLAYRTLLGTIMQETQDGPKHGDSLLVSFPIPKGTRLGVLLFAFPGDAVDQLVPMGICEQP